VTSHFSQTAAAREATAIAADLLGKITPLTDAIGLGFDRS
jgi:hypothetical protein